MMILCLPYYTPIFKNCPQESDQIHRLLGAVHLPAIFHPFFLLRSLFSLHMQRIILNFIHAIGKMQIQPES